jgi:hypothetical protein
MKKAVTFLLKFLFVHGRADNSILFAHQKVGDLKIKCLSWLTVGEKVQILLSEMNIGMITAIEGDEIVGGNSPLSGEYLSG